jgi:hypothetical protein
VSPVGKKYERADGETQPSAPKPERPIVVELIDGEYMTSEALRAFAETYDPEKSS